MVPPSARWNPLTWFKRNSTSQRTITVASDRGGLARPMDLRLESRPTPLFPMVLGGSVAVLVVTALGVAALVKVDQIVTVEGTLRTLRSTQDLKPDQAGVVTEVLVKEGSW